MPNSKVTKLFHCKLSENAKMKWIRTTDTEKVSFSSTSRSSKFRSKQFLVFIQSQNYPQVDNSFETENKIIDQCFFHWSKGLPEIEYQRKLLDEIFQRFWKKTWWKFCFVQKAQRKISNWNGTTLKIDLKRFLATDEKTRLSLAIL